MYSKSSYSSRNSRHGNNSSGRRNNNSFSRNNGGRSISSNRGFSGGNKGKRGPVGTFNPSQIVSQLSHPVASSTPEIFIAKHKFTDFNINESLKSNILKKNYSTPTPIQDESIPHMLEGRDLIGIANTGTGKTAAFLIPLINKVINNKSEKVLIVAPTRELAVQIQDEFYDFTKGLNMYSVLAIGGVSSFHQKRDLRRPYNFVIGTPGRIKDLIQGRHLDLSQFKSVVLDEADHMVDIGFIHDVKYIVALLPKERQSLFFSATIDGKVEEIIAQFVTNPITISVKKTDTVSNIEQQVVKIQNHTNKVEQLHDVLIKSEFEKVIIFGRTKHGIQKLSNELVDRGFKAGAIHGNKSQNQRQRTLKDFKANMINILLATDVASRGLDIDNVSHVINYDMPATYEDYIHRIGRTGRANKKGVALTFV